MDYAFNLRNMMLSWYPRSAVLMFGLAYVANGAIIQSPGDMMQQEYDICSPNLPNVYLDYPGDSVDIYVKVPQGAATTYSQACIAEFETCDSCRFKVSAVQPQFEYPECRQASWSENYCPLDCVYIILFDVDYKSRRRRVTNSLAADGFETESKSLQVVACSNHNLPGNITMRLRITSVEKIQHVTGSMFEPSSRRTFMSPNFPNPYVRNNEYYIYTFESLSRDQFITVTFDDWLLSPYSTVKFDGANIVNRIGGDNRPYVISTGKSMNVTFGTGERRRMSSDFSFIGFKGQARFYSNLNDIPQIESGCDRMLSTSEGGILHLNAAADGQNRDCIWIIKRLSSFDGVYVKIIRYKTRSELVNSCDYSLEVREGLTSNSAQRLSLRPNDHIPNYAVQLSENGFYIRIKGCYFDDSVVLSYAMYLDDCDDYREYYKCDNGRCIADHLRCDTYDHCGDNSDEIPSMCGYSSNNVSNTSSASYDYSLSIHVIIPLVVSVVLGIGIICLLILLVRRCRRLNNSVVAGRPRSGHGRRNRGRRFHWRNRSVQMSVTMSSGEHPPSYEEVIRSTPIGQLNMAFSWSEGDNPFAQPPSYDEAVSPTSRTTLPAATTGNQAAITNSNNGSVCHGETNLNLAQFHSRPFLVATLSASLCPAADTSLSSGSSEGTSDDTHQLDISTSSESLHRDENSLTSADCISGSFFSSNPNKNKGDSNSENISDGNIAESGNIARAVLDSRTYVKKKVENSLSVHSNISQRNNKPIYGKSINIVDDQKQYVDNKAIDATRSVRRELNRGCEQVKGETNEGCSKSSVAVGDFCCEQDLHCGDANRKHLDVNRVDSSEEGSRNRRQRRGAFGILANKYRTDSEQKSPRHETIANGFGNTSDRGGDGLGVSHSSRSRSCADLSHDNGKSRLSVANGKGLQEDKRFSYAGAGDVSLMRRGLDPYSDRSLLNTRPQGQLSMLPTVNSDSQRDVYRTSNTRNRVDEADTAEDYAQNKHNHLSNQVAEFSTSRMDKLGSPTQPSLDPVLENSYDDNDLKATTSHDAAGYTNSSRYTDHKDSSGLSQDISRNKLYPMLCEKYSFDETSGLENNHMKPDVAWKMPKQKARYSNEDHPAARVIKSPQSRVPGPHQNDSLHNPGDRQHVLPAYTIDNIQNQHKNMNPQSNKHFTGSFVPEDGVQILPHSQSQSRYSRDSFAKQSQLLSFGQGGELLAADTASRVEDIKSPQRPIPAPRVRGRNQSFNAVESDGSSFWEPHQQGQKATCQSSFSVTV